MTLKIRLVNMPFASLARPSIGLTQLRTVAEQRFGDAIEVKLNYLNHAFGSLLGEEAYNLISGSMIGHVTGFGEWFFRQAAFPDEPDNRAAYFSRFGRQFGRANQQLAERVVEPIRLRLTQVIDDMISNYRLDEADMVGLTSMFSQNLPSVALARRLRAKNPDQIIILGGANCEDIMGYEWAKQVPDIDFVFSGHSLVSFPLFIERILAGDRAGCHRLKGIYSAENLVHFKDGNGLDYQDTTGLREGAKPVTIMWKADELDLNAAVRLNYDDFFESLETTVTGFTISPDLPFETSRGCWWGAKAHCTFCGLNGGDMSYRAMSPDVARTYISDIIDRYSDRASRFGCVDNIMPREYFVSVFRDMRPPEHVELFYEVKADLTEEQVRIMRESRITVIQPGVESFATSTLKHMRKGTTAFGNLKLLLNCRKYNVTPSWNLLVGFPGEQASVYQRYLEFMPDLFHLMPPEGVFPVRFDRFSPYFTKDKEYGLELYPYEYYEYCLPFSAEAVRNIAYYFQDGNIEAQYITDLAESFSDLAELVDRWQSRWSSDGGAQPPVLELDREDGRIVLIDSREGERKTSPISAAELRLLHACTEPVEENFMRQTYGTTLDRVLHRRLVFIERGRVMNIVMNLHTGDEMLVPEAVELNRDLVTV